MWVRRVEKRRVSGWMMEGFEWRLKLEEGVV